MSPIMTYSFASAVLFYINGKISVWGLFKDPYIEWRKKAIASDTGKKNYNILAIAY